jgi:S-formylglutathione hydrolase FrmB
MPLLECFFQCKALRQEKAMHVLVPNGKRPPEGFPVLYLLHGLSESHTSWLRKTRFEFCAANAGLLVVMADAGRSFYNREYWTFFAHELPELVSNMFPVDTRRKSTFVAGQSMGGFGALKLALTYPGRFAAVAALSPVTDINSFLSDAPQSHVKLPELESYFGPLSQVRGGGNDLFRLASGTAVMPRVYLTCGKKDFLLPQNRRFRDALLTAGYSLDYSEDDGGHSWDYFNGHIGTMLDFFNSERGK